MVKSCCAIGCFNKYCKGSSISFYRFPVDKERRAKWISAIKRKDWVPNEHSWLCSAHFISGQKSNDPLSPDYIPSIFSFTSSPQKRKGHQQLNVYERRRNIKKTRLESGTNTNNSDVYISENAVQDMSRNGRSCHTMD